MQLTRLSTLALLALAGVAFQAATAVPTHQQADPAPPASDVPAASVTPTAPVSREAASSIPLAERMEFVQQQRERTTQLGKEKEAEQGTVVPVTTPFTQVDGKCPVCQEEAQEGKAVFVSDCGHFVHEECLKETPTDKRKKCPICRAARTQGSVDKLGESLHFVPAEEGGLPAVAKRFAKLLNKIAASPKDVCNNEPSTTDGWSCFRDDKQIYATEAILDAVVKSVEGATHSGCASKEAAAPGVTSTQSQQTAPAADLFATVSLPGGTGWGRINVQVQCIDQASQQGLVKVTDYPEVVLAPVAPEFSDPEEENRLNRIQQRSTEREQAIAQLLADRRESWFIDWTTQAKTLLDDPSTGEIETIDGLTGAQSYFDYVSDQSFNLYWRRIDEFFPTAEYQVSKHEGSTSPSRAFEGVFLQPVRITVTRIADSKTTFIVFTAFSL